MNDFELGWPRPFSIKSREECMEWVVAVNEPSRRMFLRQSVHCSDVNAVDWLLSLGVDPFMEEGALVVYAALHGDFEMVSRLVGRRDVPLWIAEKMAVSAVMAGSSKTLDVAFSCGCKVTLNLFVAALRGSESSCALLPMLVSKLPAGVPDYWYSLSASFASSHGMRFLMGLFAPEDFDMFASLTRSALLSGNVEGLRKLSSRKDDFAVVLSDDDALKKAFCGALMMRQRIRPLLVFLVETGVRSWEDLLPSLRECSNCAADRENALELVSVVAECETICLFPAVSLPSRLMRDTL